MTDILKNSKDSNTKEIFVPPMLHGVTASKVFLTAQNEHDTIYGFLCAHFPHIQAIEWQQRFDDGLVFDLSGKKLTRYSPYQNNQHIYYYRFLAHEITVPFEHEIIFENDDLLVVDKPHFLTMTPTGQYVQQTLLVRLKQQTGNAELTPIHRLDRETAGIVLFSKRPETRGLYQQLFATRKIEKVYHAIAPYNAKHTFPITTQYRMEKGEPFYTMQIIDGQMNSETRIELLEHNNIWAKYCLYPKTGKQHQLRVHLNALGLPIRHDPFYPTVAHKADDDFSQPLQLLAKALSFEDPVTKKKMRFISQKDLLL
ncbi:pseudouridine synthase [Acinetobacter sp. ME22]|uniref:pseudouridine synthase n=1 Tax=Acinetobacter sp. ME22 TaxID=2904802 RepID=UPI001EDC6F32|nr:pseudouridine synthase [Acinetobacter sp. ME22]MCG2574198.1 pseudouridine synthase [Acinetobacter sp. ME22]